MTSLKVRERSNDAVGALSTYEHTINILNLVSQASAMGML